MKSFGGCIVDMCTETRVLVEMIYVEQGRAVRREQDVVGLETFC